MTNDYDIDILIQLNIIQNNVFNELFTEHRQYMGREDPFIGEFNVKFI